MEIAWIDRGKVAHDAYFMRYGPEKGFDFDRLSPEEQEHWSYVFNQCRKSEKKMIPGGDEILIVEG